MPKPPEEHIEHAGGFSFGGIIRDKLHVEKSAEDPDYKGDNPKDDEQLLDELKKRVLPLKTTPTARDSVEQAPIQGKPISKERAEAIVEEYFNFVKGETSRERTKKLRELWQTIGLSGKYNEQKLRAETLKELMEGGLSPQGFGVEEEQPRTPEVSEPETSPAQPPKKDRGKEITRLYNLIQDTKQDPWARVAAFDELDTVWYTGNSDKSRRGRANLESKFGSIVEKLRTVVTQKEDEDKVESKAEKEKILQSRDVPKLFKLVAENRLTWQELENLRARARDGQQLALQKAVVRKQIEYKKADLDKITDPAKRAALEQAIKAHEEWLRETGSAGRIRSAKPERPAAAGTLAQKFEIWRLLLNNIESLLADGKTGEVERLFQREKSKITMPPPGRMSPTDKQAWKELFDRQALILEAYNAKSKAAKNAVNQEKTELTRRATQITLARVPKYTDLHPLHAATEKEGDEKFKELTRQVWKQFVVHGTARMDKETGKIIIKRETDLDGRSAAGLMLRAGLDIRNVEYVAAGQARKGKINIDTGGKSGLAVEDDGRTAYFDHHTNGSTRNSSATKVVYETLTELGLLEHRAEWDKIVDFVTKFDNMSYPAEEYGMKSVRTMLGLRNWLEFEDMEKLFKAGKNPLTPLTDAELKAIEVAPSFKQRSGHVVPAQTLLDMSRLRLASVEQSEARLKEMEREGLIIDSKDYGKVVVDIHGSIRTSSDAAKAYGAGAFIKWMPETQSFFLSTYDHPLKHKFDQGDAVRDTMWIKPMTDGKQLTVKLKDILNNLTDGRLQAAGKLQEYLNQESKSGDEPEEVREEDPLHKEITAEWEESAREFYTNLGYDQARVEELVNEHRQEEVDAIIEEINKEE